MKIKPKNLETPNPVFSGFRKFCSETSIHGWSYLMHDMSKTWRTIWSIIVTFNCLLTVFFLYQTSTKLYDSTTVTTIESTMASLKDITFPSIWICNVNQVLRGFG